MELQICNHKNVSSTIKRQRPLKYSTNRICMKSAGVSIYNRREVTAIYTVVHIVDVTGRLGWPGKIAEICMKSAGVSIYNRREVTAIYTVVHIVDVAGRWDGQGKLLKYA